MAEHRRPRTGRYSTVLIVNYDENDGFFDHTSVIRFLETWTGVRSNNISAWRRAICGDLNSCFDFSNPDPSIPTLPDATALRAEADNRIGIPIIVNPPASGQQKFPVQETGTKPAQALPYAPVANGALDSTGNLAITFGNTGSAAVPLAAYRADGQADGPWQYDVSAAGSATGVWDLQAQAGGQYAIAVHGPNRFLWTLAGSAASSATSRTGSKRHRLGGRGARAARNTGNRSSSARCSPQLMPQSIIGPLLTTLPATRAGRPGSV